MKIFRKKINEESQILAHKGLKKLELGDKFGAIEMYTKAIELQNDNQIFYLIRGSIYEEIGNDLEAKNDYSKSISLDKNNFVAAFRLGMLFYKKDDLENAIKWLTISYNNSIEIDQIENTLGRNNILFVSKKVIANNLGDFLIRVDKIDKGLKYINEAIKLDPEYSNPYLSKGIALVQLNRIPESIKYFERAITLGNTDAEKILEQLKQITNNQDLADDNHLDKSEILNKVDEFYQRALKYADNGDQENALNMISEMHTILPNNDSVYLTSAALKIEFGDIHGALKDSQRCVEINPNNALGWNHLGYSLCKCNNIPEGLDCFKKASALGLNEAERNYKKWERLL